MNRSENIQYLQSGISHFNLHNMNKLVKIIILGSFFLQATNAYTQPKTDISANKKAVLASVAKQEAALISMSDKIWSYAETALGESQSSKVLSDYVLNKYNGMEFWRNK